MTAAADCRYRESYRASALSFIAIVGRPEAAMLRARLSTFRYRVGATGTLHEGGIVLTAGRWGRLRRA